MRWVIHENHPVKTFLKELQRANIHVFTKNLKIIVNRDWHSIHENYDLGVYAEAFSCYIIHVGLKITKAYQVLSADNKGFYH